MIDLLEINNKYQVPSNNLLLILPSKSLKSIYSFFSGYSCSIYSFRYDDFNLFKNIEYEFKLALINSIPNWENMIDVLCNKNKISIKLPSGSIDITGFKSKSTHLIIKSNFDYKETKLIKIEPYQTYYHLIIDYLCELTLHKNKKHTYKNTRI